MADTYTVAMKIIGDSASAQAAISGTRNSMRRMVSGLKNDLASLKSAWGSVTGKLAAVGLGFGAFQIAKSSAVLDRQLTRIRLSAGRTREEAQGLREQLERLSMKTGQSTDELAGGFERLFKLTGSWDAAAASIGAVNTAVKTTGANTDILAESLAVAQTSFGKDIDTKSGAMGVLNMLAGAEAGAGGLENVAGIFNQIAPLASLSGMSFDGAVSLIATMSQVTKNPGQIGEFAGQTLKLFTNLRAVTNKKSMLGGLLFDDEGNRRDPMESLRGLKDLYDSLSEKKKLGLLSQLTAGDPRAARSIQMLLESAAFKKPLEIKSANLEQRLPEAMNNAADQAARLKNILGETAEGFVRPINKVLADAAQFMLDKLPQMGINETDALVGLGAAGLTAYIGGNLVKGPLGKLLGGKAGLAAGVAEGSALKYAGVTPVYVVNFSQMAGGIPGGNVPVPSPIPGDAGGIAGKATSLLFNPVTLAAGLTIAGGYAAYRMNQEYINEHAGPAEMRNTKVGTITDPVTGRVYDPFNTETDDQKYPLFAPASAPQKQETSITIFIDGEKKKPAKTITENRGAF